MTENRFDRHTLADHLDTILPPGQYGTPDRDADPFIDAAILIAAPAQPDVMSDETKMRIRSQVLAAAQPTPAVRSPGAHPALRLVTRWGIAAGLLLAFLFIGLQPVVLASVPGDLLYPLKDTVEMLELEFAATNVDRAYVHLSHAERRTQEALVLVERGHLEAGLLTETLQDMYAAAEIVHNDTGIDTNVVVRLEARTLQVNALLNAVMTLADRSDQIPQELVTNLALQVQATQASGTLLLPSTVTPSPIYTLTPTTTLVPSHTPTDTVLSSPTLIPTQVPSVTPNPVKSPTTVSATATELSVEATSTGEEPAMVVVEGPVEAITVNVITVFGIAIRLDPATSLLKTVQVGDVIRVEGTMTVEGDVIIITAMTITKAEPEVIAPPGAQSPNLNSNALPANCKITPKGKVKCSKTSKKS